MKKAVSPGCCIKINICSTVASAMNLEYFKEWLNTIESVLKSIIRISDVTVLTPVLNNVKNVPSTTPRRAFKVKPEHFKARLVALD